jgi:NAD(P)-dependent dehydrogenase (short-subunit alcohol dehydrogenase family)
VDGLSELAMSLVGLFKGKGPSGFGYTSTAEEVAAGVDLKGRTLLVTGVASGLGLETLRVLAGRGATVVGLARTEEKVHAAAKEVGVEAVAVACDLSEPASVRAAVATTRDRVGELYGIITNAGIMALPKREVKHGVELQMLTNHVGHFILVTGLLDRLAPDGRVTVLSSAAHTGAPSFGVDLDDPTMERGYTAWGAYGSSKLANLLFARELARRLPAGQVTNALHPGVIHTNLGRHMGGVMSAMLGIAGPLFLKTIPQGAATQCWAAVNAATATMTGEYLADCNVAASNALGRDAALATRVWEQTERLVAKL